MTPRDEIRMEGALLGIGESRRILCPLCRGGQSNERSMNITRTADGVVYNCHRNSCPAPRGFVGTGAGEVHVPREKEPTLYTGELLPLRKEDVEFFQTRYEIDGGDHEIKLTEHDEYVLPIFSPERRISGYNVRQPWPGAPAKGRPNRPKSRVYAESSRPVQSFYGHARDLPILLVEDQLSAMKADRHAKISYAVALMGSNLDIPQVQEIARMGAREVLLALDADATETAFRLARKYGLAFPRMRVVILDRDIKDTPSKSINRVLGL